MTTPADRRAPTRIDQIIPSIVEHDAVSNHTFAAQRILREMGYISEIYARIIGPGAHGRVHPLSELPRIADGSQWVLYQSSIGSPAAEVFAAHPGEKLLDYHNITPAELVERWLPPLGAESRLGRRQLQELAPHVRFAFADSPYNASELVSFGYRGARVVPVLIESDNLAAAPDQDTAIRLRERKRDGAPDWLFVGQLGAHKAQHDIVKALASYRRIYASPARLHLVGREMGNTYRDALRRFIRLVGLEDAVELTGSVDASKLAAYYESADVFVCCSDHEGFCAPIIEAMARGVPVIAFSAAAVPDTVGDAGLLLRSKSAPVVAAAVQRVLGDDQLRDEMAARGRSRARLFSLSAAEHAFHQAITDAVGSG